MNKYELYDHDDHDDYNDQEPLPYRPLHPIREGFTMGVCFTIVVGVVVWLLWRVFT